MKTWTPLWSKVVDSSIWLEDKNTRILFVTMLALKDRDHVVRHSAFELARKANLTEAEVIESLEVLKSPDTKRIEPQEFEGRRVEKVEDGWFMLNGEKYRKAMQEMFRKEYKRGKQAEYRDKDDDKTKAEAANGYHPDSRTVLHLMNEISGRRLREIHDHLSVISKRLKEDGVDLEGCKLMLARQWGLWKDAYDSSGKPMREHYQPSTLFKTAKFDNYYSSRELPIHTKPAAVDPTDRNASNSNRHLIGQYATVGKAYPVDKDGNPLPP